MDSNNPIPAIDLEPIIDPMPIIDTHQHLWDRNLFHLTWLDGPLDRDFLLADYAEATTGLNVVKTVYMEVNMGPALVAAEADYVIGLCQREDNPLAAVVLGGDPAGAGFSEYARNLREQPFVVGVRQILQDRTSGTCLRPEFIAGVRLLGELGLSFDLCIRPRELSDAVQLVDSCPGTQFILDHCGNADPGVVSGQRTSDPGSTYQHDADQWRQDIAALSERKNVVCKISGVIAQIRQPWSAADLAPTVDHCLDSFGPNRVIFGGDWPVCILGAPLSAWALALLEVISTRSGKNQLKLMHDNAVRIYGLS